MKIINKKKFTKTAIDENVEAFVIYITSLSLNLMPIHPAQEAQIALLVIKKVQILFKYSDFSNGFSKEKTSILLEASNLNQHAIELEKSQQPPYRLIYSLCLVKLEMLKTYIKTNLANSFIWPLKSPTDAFIFFVRKLNGSFCLYVNYWGLNNLTIKIGIFYA